MSTRTRSDPPDAPVSEIDASPLEELLDQPLAAEPERRGPRCLVGEVVDDRHPHVQGRVRVRWQGTEGSAYERWLPTLHGLTCRGGDRVVLTGAENWRELIVTGVVDGFARRPEPTRATTAQLELRRDEAVRIRDEEGRDLLELVREASGPVVRFLSEDVDLETKGKLRVRARSIELSAREGSARLEASGDVCLKGEIVRLN